MYPCILNYMSIRSIFLISIFTCYCCAARSQADFQKPAYPVPVIFDTDFGPDYDDVGAITLLHCFADSGWVRILATMASSKHKISHLPSMFLILTSTGRK